MNLALKKNKFFGDKNFYKGVLMLAIPIIIQQLITSFVNMLDNIMVGQTGTFAMSGVSVANQLITVFNLAIFGLVSAASIFAAQFAGKKDYKNVQNCLYFDIVLSFIVSVISVLIFWVFGEKLLYLFMNPDTDTVKNINTTMKFALDYTKIMTIGFIPFAFSKSYDTFFINNNVSIKELKKSNSFIENSENTRTTLFGNMKESAEYIGFDVEVILKSRDKNYYETVYVREKAINIFKQSDDFDYKGIKFWYRDDEKNPKYMEPEVVNRILNGIRMDSIIELLFKSKNNHSYNIKTLIAINNLIYEGGSEMTKNMKSAYASAKRVSEKLEENKLNSYKQKLISAVTFKNKDRFCEILLQLSSFSGVVFDFAYDLFDDFENNKNLAYTFINALNKEGNKENGGDK